MPLFEFICQECQAKFELLVRIQEKEHQCPQCYSRNIKKKFSPFGMKSNNKFISSIGGGCGTCTSHNCQGCHCE